jgi:hypothetical protein
MLLRCCEVLWTAADLWTRWGNAERFPGLVYRRLRLSGQAGIGAADLPTNSQRPSTDYAPSVRADEALSK